MVFLLLFAALLWIGLIALSPDLHSSDGLGRGIARALSTVGAIAIWILLAVALILAAINSHASLPSTVFAGCLVLGSVAAALATINLTIHTDTPRWLTIVVLAPPPMLACLALAMHYPAVREAAPAALINGICCAIVALALMPCPFLLRQARAKAEAKARMQAAYPRAYDERSLFSTESPSEPATASDQRRM